MARFYAEIHGNRGEASRMGTAASGMVSHTRGWNLGARVTMWAKGDRDVCTVALTGGSNGHRRTLVTIEATELGDGILMVEVLSQGLGGTHYYDRDGNVS